VNIEKLRKYCLSKNKVTESFPFDNVTLVFKVLDKMFALTNLDGDLSINLKCSPDKVVELREKQNAVKPGYHMNKNHWNTIEIDGTIDDNLIKSWIDDSYALVVSKMSKIKQQELEIIK